MLLNRDGPAIAVPVERAAWLLAGGALFLVLYLHLLPALLAGLLVFELVHLTAPMLASRWSHRRARAIVAVLFASLAVGGVAMAMAMAVAFFGDSGHLANLATKMAEILENSRESLPDWLLPYIPGSVDELKTAVVAWLREHAGELQMVGKEAGITLAHMLIGLIIGAMVAVQATVQEDTARPLAAALARRAGRLADAFRDIVFAQVRISLVNTVFTALYLAAALPLFGVDLPLVKTMIALTFVAGLLPVIGNLISNSVIVVVSLAHSPHAALASLGFLVVIHKLEYFLNARIVGGQIAARAWELLLAMLVMEAAFGLQGVVAAPIFYAYLKTELRSAALI
ncbi:AI-2E family transporter [Parasulfuritortus cantonensis]|uniref:AI-2E family transporter n=1 Tax=Parasulfuritortus cantonensis TaxID=2528202 RepID=A0A4R1B1E0_9PROT|nr:AI-2E family transporter [Parasulfuritortus cantonensis]TCJ11591.1 AI-2E family transporter [Parasulfuritortus cantonensis]